MPLTTNREVFITCAITGSGATQDRSHYVPRSPEQIAQSAIEAAQAGAAIVHCHVRDPQTGEPSRELKFYQEVVERIRASKVDMIINLTAGMGGDLVFGSAQKPLPLDPSGTDMAGAEERVEHIKLCRPEICTLDCGTMNFAEANYVMTNPPGMLRQMAKLISNYGTLPEIEVFDSGHLWFAKQLIDEKIIKEPALLQLCMGIPWGAPNDLSTYLALVNNLPTNCNFSSFSLGAAQMPYVALSVLAGGNVRVGLEDNLYISKGKLASNVMLVENAVEIIEKIGSRVLSATETRKKLGL